MISSELSDITGSNPVTPIHPQPGERPQDTEQRTSVTQAPSGSGVFCAGVTTTTQVLPDRTTQADTDSPRALGMDAHFEQRPPQPFDGDTGSGGGTSALPAGTPPNSLPATRDAGAPSAASRDFLSAPASGNGAAGVRLSYGSGCGDRKAPSRSGSIPASAITPAALDRLIAIQEQLVATQAALVQAVTARTDGDV